MNRRTSFQKIKSHTFLDLNNRPGFKAGSITTTGKDVPSIATLNKRNGRGDRLIQRPGFLKPPIKARTAFEFQALEAIDIANAKDSFEADPSLKNIKETWVNMPDPTDFIWLTERTRLNRKFTARFQNAGFPADQLEALVEKELRVNPPFGRPQRTIRVKTTNIKDQADLTNKKKLKELLEAVQDQGSQTTVETDAILNELQAIVSQMGVDRAAQSADIITQITTALKVKPTTLVASIGHQFIDLDFLQKNEGAVFVLLKTLAKKQGKNPNKPVTNNQISISLADLISKMKRNPKNLFLNLNNGSTVSLFDMTRIAKTNKNQPNLFSFDISRFLSSSSSSGLSGNAPIFQSSS